MAIIKAVSSRASIGNAIKYITKTEKTEEKLITGIGCSPYTAYEEMMTTKSVWNKKDGRQYKHYIHSYDPKDALTPEKAHEITLKLCEAEKRFDGFEVIIATHKDRTHIHSHIIVNSVNFLDGHKIQCTSSDLSAMKERSNKLCAENGLNTTKKTDEITVNNGAKYNALKKAVEMSGYKSYVYDCYTAVRTASLDAISRADFIEKLKTAGYETNWSDSRKYITFTDRTGNKIRNSNLEKTFKEAFSKEALENGFAGNYIRARNADKAREQLRAIRVNQGTNGRDTEIDRVDGNYPAVTIGNPQHQIKTGSGKSTEPSAGANDTRAVIAQFNAVIAQSRAQIEADERDRRNRRINEENLGATRGEFAKGNETRGNFKERDR